MAAPQLLVPSNTVVAFVSFEGPDAYSRVGELGSRVSRLTETLAEIGVETHHFFIGDPALPGMERRADGRLVLHRWCQWISAYSPHGVYENEEARIEDVTRSLPPYLLEHVVQPALASGRVPVIMMEEWQTAAAVRVLSDLLVARGIRGDVVLMWHANDTPGFARLDWKALAEAATLTTVSWHMRAIIRNYGADAFVIPHGIEEDLLEPVTRTRVRAVRAALSPAEHGAVFFKTGEWQATKGWDQTLDAIALTHTMGRRVRLIGRTDTSSPPRALERAAEARGLRIATVRGEREFNARLGAIGAPVDILSLQFAPSEELSRTLFAAADAVLANAVVEPFGLMGLHAMAAGAVVFTGGTGEDYAVAGRNAVVLRTLDPLEIVSQWEELEAAGRAPQVRRAARQTARQYVWPRIAGRLLDIAGQQLRRQHRRALASNQRLPRATRALEEPRLVRLPAPPRILSLPRWRSATPVA